MKTIILIMSMFTQLPRPQTLYIAVDSTINSQMLKRELDADWFARINPVVFQLLNPTQITETKEFCSRMEGIKKKIFKFWKLEYVDYQDENSPRGIYPQYRIGRYREWKEFDKRAFSEISYPLRTVEYLHDQWRWDTIDGFGQILSSEHKNALQLVYWQLNRDKVYYKWLEAFRKSDEYEEYKDVHDFNAFPESETYVKYKQELKDRKLREGDEPTMKILKLPYE